MNTVHPFKVFLVFTALALIVACLALIPEGVEGLAIALVVVFCVLCLLPTVVDKFRGRYQPFEMIHCVCYLSMIQYGLATLYLLYDRRAAYDSRVYPYLVPSLLLCIGGTASMIYGYYIARKVKARTIVRVLERGTAWILVVFALGAAGQMSGLLRLWELLRSRKVNAIESMIETLSSLHLLAFFLLFFLLFSHRATIAQKLALFLVVVPAEMGFLYLTVGNKFQALTILGLPFIALWYARGRLPRGTVVALILLTVFVIFPFYNTFKSFRGVRSTDVRVEKSLKKLSRLTPEDYTRQSFFEVGKRMALINSVAVVLRETGRTVDYQYGSTIYLTAISLAIPRFLWPDKPIITIGVEFAHQFHITPRSDEETYVAPTTIGELCWNFGVPGVIGGMFLIGVVYQMVYRFLGAAGIRDPLRLAMYVSLLPTMMSFESNIAAWAGGMLRTLLFYVALEWVLRSWPRTRSHAAP